jgi:putative membrane protein
MNKIVKAVTASVLTVSMCGCSVAADEASATAASTADTKAEETSSSKQDADEAYTSEQTGKDETVYVFTGADGEMDHMIVSDTLHTAGKTGAVEDYSTLDNIENVSGDEEYSSDDNGNMTWTSDGSDISYQGTTDEEIPVDVKITYYLDDNEVSADEIKGASGHVRVRFDYTNNAETVINVNGTDETVKVPFGMVTGLTLNAADFTNVTVTNGRMNQYNDSDVIYGLALPGLKESLETASVSDLDLTTIDIPEYFEFEADTTDFDIDLCMTIATSNVLSLLSTDDLDLSSISDSAEELSTAGQTLVDGTQSLKDGTDQLLSGADSLDSGADSLLSGTSTLSDGASSLATGTSDLADGAQSLSDGASQVNDGAAQLQEGAQELADGAASLDENLGTALSGAQTLSDGLKTLTDNNSTLNNGAQQIVDAIFAAANEQLSSYGYPTITEDNYNTVLSEAGNVTDEMREAALKAVSSDSSVQAAAQASGVDADTLAEYLIYLSALDYGAENALSEDNLAAEGAVLSNAFAVQTKSAAAEASAANSPYVNDKKVIAALKAYAASTEYLTAAEATGYSTVVANVKKGVNSYLQSINSSIQIDDDTAKVILAYASEEYGTAFLTDTDKLSQAATEVLNGARPKGSTDLTNKDVQTAIDAAVTADALSDLETFYSTVVRTIASLQGISTDDAALLVVYTAENYGSLSTENLAAAGTELKSAYAIGNKVAASQLADGEKLTSTILSTAVMNSTIQTVATQLASVESFKQGLQQYTAGVSSAYDGSKSLVDGLSKLKDGSSSLSTGAQTLLTGVNTLAAGTQSLADGAVSLNDGAAKLKSGAATLYNGSLTLYSGVKTLKDGTTSLKSGVVSLDEGAAELASGMEQFYEEGIKKIGDVLGEDLPSVVDSLKGLTDAGAEYKTFSGALDDDNNTCKFIFKTEFSSDED